MNLLKEIAAGIAIIIYSGLIGSFLFILLPELIYACVKGRKWEKFLDNNIIKNLWVILTLVIFTFLIAAFIHLVV